MNNLPVVRSPWRIAILTVGFTFLYAPMLMLVIYSFNSSKLVTVWAGWSTRWYTELFHDSAMISAVGLSLTIAAASATAAVVLGAIAAVVMVRFGRFRGSTGFAFMLTAPLVMPDVITGLSLLLLFVAMGHAFGWPSERGMFTIWLAHVTFCTAYVAVVISSRLREVDRSIEEAAMDLGAPPGDVMQAANRAKEAKNGVNVAYAIPKEGALTYFDMFAMPADAKNKDAAYQFLNFLMKPDVMAGISNYVYYANAVKDSTPLVKAEVRENPNVYPPADLRAKLFTLNVQSPKLDRVITRAWTKVKSGK